MYGFENNLLPPIFESFFAKISDVHIHATRSTLNRVYYTPQVATQISKKSLKSEGIEIWSRISSDLKDLNFGGFSRRLKDRIIACYKH